MKNTIAFLLLFSVTSTSVHPHVFSNKHVAIGTGVAALSVPFAAASIYYFKQAKKHPEHETKYKLLAFLYAGASVVCLVGGSTYAIKRYGLPEKNLEQISNEQRNLLKKIINNSLIKIREDLRRILNDIEYITDKQTKICVASIVDGIDTEMNDQSSNKKSPSYAMKKETNDLKLATRLEQKKFEKNALEKLLHNISDHRKEYTHEKLLKSIDNARSSILTKINETNESLIGATNNIWNNKIKKIEKAIKDSKARKGRQPNKNNAHNEQYLLAVQRINDANKTVQMLQQKKAPGNLSDLEKKILDVKADIISAKNSAETDRLINELCNLVQEHIQNQKKEYLDAKEKEESKD